MRFFCVIVLSEVSTKYTATAAEHAFSMCAFWMWSMPMAYARISKTDACTQTRAMNKAVNTRIRHTWRERNDMHMSHALYLVVLTTAPTTEVRMQAQTGERRIFLETSHRIWIHKCIQNHCTHATHATLVSAFHSTVKIYMLHAVRLEEKWEEFTRQHASTVHKDSANINWTRPNENNWNFSTQQGMNGISHVSSAFLAPNKICGLHSESRSTALAMEKEVYGFFLLLLSLSLWSCFSKIYPKKIGFQDCERRKKKWNSRARAWPPTICDQSDNEAIALF